MSTADKSLHGGRPWFSAAWLSLCYWPFSVGPLRTNCSGRARALRGAEFAPSRTAFLLSGLLVGLTWGPWTTGQGATATSNAFTYQGEILVGGQPASGSYDLQFGLTDAAVGGNYIGGLVTNTAVPVVNGRFTVALDFGGVGFDGSARWIEVGVRASGSATNFSLLSPRQALTAAPYALFSLLSAQSGFATQAGTAAAVGWAALPGRVLTNAGAFDAAGAAQGATNALNPAAFTGQSSYATNAGSVPLPGWFFAFQYGYSPTNTPDGNAAALDACIAACAQRGGGVVFIGNPGGSNGVIQDSGEHLLAGAGSGHRPNVRLVGDGATSIQYTRATTRHAVFYGVFDAENLILQGPGANAGWAYPFTNCVGLECGPFYGPRLSNLQVAGFSQGIALEYTVNPPGARLEHCYVSQCTVGYALGDDADNTHLEGCSAGGCRYGFYNSIMTPLLTDVFGSFPQGVILIDTAGAVVIDGGVWATNQVGIVTGDALWMHVLNAGFWGNQTYHIGIGMTPDNWNYGNAWPKLQLDNLDYYGSRAILTNVAEYSVYSDQITMRNIRAGGWYGFGMVAHAPQETIVWENLEAGQTNVLYIVPDNGNQLVYTGPNGNVNYGFANGPNQGLKLVADPQTPAPSGTFLIDADTAVWSAGSGPFAVGFMSGGLGGRFARMDAETDYGGTTADNFYLNLSNMSLRATGPIISTNGFVGDGFSLTNLSVAAIAGLGTAAYSNATVFMPASAALTNLAIGNGTVFASGPPVIQRAGYAVPLRSFVRALLCPAIVWQQQRGRQFLAGRGRLFLVPADHHHQQPVGRLQGGRRHQYQHLLGQQQRHHQQLRGPSRGDRFRGVRWFLAPTRAPR